jgi:predicted nucleic acid-binding protein
MANQTSKIFLDANILLEAVMFRGAKLKADEIIRNNCGSIYISALTAHLVIHFGVKVVELNVLKQFLLDFEIISLAKSDFAWAFINIKDNDFEDALQLATAIKEGCEKFITFDKNLYKKYQYLSQIKVELA